MVASVRVPSGLGCFACMLGGSDGATLFLLTSAGIDYVYNRRERPGCIRMVEVDAPRAGWP